MVTTAAEASQSDLRWYWHVASLCIAVALVVSRRPDAIFHAQFFAEDGHVWFADAWNRGWFTSLFRTQDGYFQTLPRLAAALSLLTPLIMAPLVMNIIGLFFQLLPVPLLLSHRLSRLGSLQLRAMLAFTYLALPNCAEVNITVTEGQWHLALVACLLLLGSTPNTRVWKLFDIGVFVLCGLTGPFAFLLAPIAAVSLWFRRDRWAGCQLGILICAIGVQANALLVTDSAARNHWPLGASPEWLVRIVAGQVYLGTILGSNTLAFRAEMPFLICTAVGGLSLMAYCFCKAQREWKLLLLFSSMILAASLRSPMTSSLPAGLTLWRLIAGVSGIRYWFFPTLAFAWTAVWCAFGEHPGRLPKAIGAALLFVMMFGVIRDWRHPAYKDRRFDSYAARFEASAPGSVQTLPENPNGWNIRLVKR